MGHPIGAGVDDRISQPGPVALDILQLPDEMRQRTALLQVNGRGPAKGLGKAVLAAARLSQTEEDLPGYPSLLVHGDIDLSAARFHPAGLTSQHSGRGLVEGVDL